MVGIRKILFEDIGLTARTLLVVEQSLSSLVFDSRGDRGSKRIFVNLRLA